MSFTIFDLLKSEKIPEQELKMMFKYFDDYIDWSDDEWIETLKLQKIKFYWCDSMTDENKVLGAWSFITPNSIYLKAPNRTELTGNFYKDKPYWDGHFNLIFPTLLHELYHMYQFKTFTIFLWPFIATPVIREFTIEPPAYKISDEAMDWMLDYQNREFEQIRKMLYADVYDIWYDIDNDRFVENFDMKYCLQRYNEYVERRKARRDIYYTCSFPAARQ